MSKTFLITGVSTGLGLAIARRAQAAGHRVQDDFDAWEKLSRSTDSTEGGVTVA